MCVGRRCVFLTLRSSVSICLWKKKSLSVSISVSICLYLKKQKHIFMPRLTDQWDSALNLKHTHTHTHTHGTARADTGDVTLDLDGVYVWEELASAYKEFHQGSSSFYLFHRPLLN